MRTTVEPLEGNKVKLSIEVEEQEFESRVDATLRRIAREVRIPGFRPGKAPRRILEARMGRASVRQETMQDALPDFYAEALRQTEVDAIAPPAIEITAGEEAGPVAFDAVVEVRPQLSVAGYQGLQATVARITASEEEIDAQIDRLRRQSGVLEATDRALQDGDFATVDIRATKDGEEIAGLTTDDYLYEVGTGGILPEVDEQLRGAERDAELAFTATLGEDTIDFTVRVKDTQEMALPEPDDEWASEASEFETVQELRDDLRRRMNEVRRMQANLQLREEVVKELVALIEDDVPEALVNAEMQRRLEDLGHRLEHQNATLGQYLQATGQTEETFVDDLRRASTESVKADLALRAVADSEGLDATEEDIDNEIAKLAEQLNSVDAASIRGQLERADQMPAVRSDIRKAKALGWLMDHVAIVDEEGNPIDRADLEPTPAAESETADAVVEGTENA